MTTIQLGNKTFIIPEKQSNCGQWKLYFDQLKKAFGKQFATSAWLLTWRKNGNAICTTDSEFNKWLAGKQIDVSTAATRAIADISDIGGNVLGLGENLTGLIASLPKVVMAGGIGILLLLFFLVFNTFKNQQMDLSSLASLSPGGSLIKSLT